MYDDPNGKCPFCPWIDAVVDIGFVLYDVGEIAYDYSTTGDVDPVSVAALTAGAASILAPMATGAGLAVRAAAKSEKVLDTVSDGQKALENSSDVAKLLGPIGGPGATVTSQIPKD